LPQIPQGLRDQQPPLRRSTSAASSSRTRITRRVPRVRPPDCRHPSRGELCQCRWRMHFVGTISVAALLAAPGPSATAQTTVPVPIQLENAVHAVGGGREDQWKVAPVPRPQAGIEMPRPREGWQPNGGGTYRTLCVRLCDGFYFPISFATTRSRFAKDASRCERLCPSRSRLYAYRNPGQEVDDMVDRDGVPYAKLPTAFHFRSRHAADCTCRGNPWDVEAIEQHQSYSAAQPPGPDAFRLP
jgi:hypothetical protein